MKTTKISIKNLFGIKEFNLDGSSVELTGTNGSGKTSVIDAIRYALTNDSDRDFIVKQGETEGEIIIETDTGLHINRKKRTTQADYKSVKENGSSVSAPESFLQQLFTPLQLNPVEFTQLDKKEQNRIILDLIEFEWDLEWIKSKFGEIPEGVDYTQNILQVLSDIQSENGEYFKKRQDLNRDIRNKRTFIGDIAKDIPLNYEAEKWQNYDIGAAYKKLNEIQAENSKIQRARIFKESYDNKIRGLEAEKELAVSVAQKAINTERENLTATVARLKAEITAAEDKLNVLDEKLADKVKIAISEYEAKVAQLDSDTQIADRYANLEPTDCSDLSNEVALAEQMMKHLNEYNRMKSMQGELDDLIESSRRLTEKIELARNLPGEILKTATIPIDGFSVENGIPLINGLPVSNLSEGEQLNLCVDVALSNPSNLQIILIDGVEKLSDENREKLYAKCKEKGLQFIATRTTNGRELEVTYL